MSKSVILVPLDGSEPALAALPIAKVLGEIEQASLLLVQVGESEMPDAALLDRLKFAGQEVEDATVETYAGEPAAEILRIADEIKPQMVVLCKHTATEPRNALGSTAMNVLRKVSCPLVLVPPERGSRPWHLHHLLVPHDGTPSTSAALWPAADIASHAHAELLIVHVADVRPAPTESGSLTTPPYVDQPHYEWPAWSSEFVKRVASICPLGLLHVRLLLARGNPAEEIGRLAREQSTDLAVVAWRGLWEMPRAAIFKDLVSEARCPVMVVRA
jgi:nucleotide-binding universal stress UspA family protein